MKLPITTAFFALFSLITLASFSQITTNSQWTWMSGDSVINIYGVYGAKGIPNINNKPGSRAFAASWRDLNGKFWLFGGSGYANSASQGLNDLWSYDPTLNIWTWISGDSTVNNGGIYGTKGIPSSLNKPASTLFARTWTDNNGNLWLFGGNSNTLWKYDPLVNQWTWMSGNNHTGTAYGVYGTKGIASSSNVPGSRDNCISWFSNNALWLFGGNGYGSLAGEGDLNDLWKYDLSTNQWTWMSGDNIPDQWGVYGSKGVPSSTNKPGSREASGSWIDGSGNLWLFGGTERNLYTDFDDVWEYNITSNQWIWINGDNDYVQYYYTVYGIQGIASTNNKPGSRGIPICWKDENGDFWMFGGWGYTTNNSGDLNDVWKYDVANNMWTWVKGDSAINVRGAYNQIAVPDNSSKPGARDNSTGWVDSNHNFWLFGGYSYTRTSYGVTNDLWKITPAGTCGTAFTWIGITSTDWTVGTNWCGGVVPGINDDAIIPAGTSYSAIVPTGISVSCRSLTIQTGATVTVSSNAHINVTH